MTNYKFNPEILDTAKTFIESFDRLFVAEDGAGIPDLTYNVHAGAFRSQSIEIADRNIHAWSDLSDTHSSSIYSEPLMNYLRSLRIWYSPTFQEGLKRLHKGKDVVNGMDVPRIDLRHIAHKEPEGIINYMYDYQGSTAINNVPIVVEVFEEIFGEDFSHLIKEKQPQPDPLG